MFKFKINIDDNSPISSETKTLLKQIVRYFPLAFMALLISIKLYSFEVYWGIMAKEDGLAEYATSLVYLITTVIAIQIALRFKKSDQKSYAILYTLAAIGFFIIAMEEISWGQRIMGLQSPEFFVAHNDQDEINLHNFLTRYPLHILYIVVSGYCALAWKLVPKKWQQQYPKLCQLIIPDRRLFWYFFPATALYLYYDYISPFLVNVLGITAAQLSYTYEGFIIAKDQEPIELLMSIGFMCFMIIIRYSQTSKQILDPIVNEQKTTRSRIIR